MRDWAERVVRRSLDFTALPWSGVGNTGLQPCARRGRDTGRLAASSLQHAQRAACPSPNSVIGRIGARSASTTRVSPVRHFPRQS